MAIRRAFLALSLAILGVIPTFAASIGTNQFSGLNTQDNPSALQPSQSPDLLNVRLQPGGKSVFKRDGYGLFQTLPSGQAIHGAYHFQQTGGADVQLWGSSTTLYSSVNDATVVAIATGTLNATWQCTDNLGFAYCVTSANDTPVKTDGSVANTSYQPSIPAGTIIASTPLQLLVAGVSGNASTIYVSANNNFTNFTTGPLPTDPYVEIVNSPGSRLTHLGYYFGNVYFWKDQSMGYMSGSANQNTVGFTIVSNQIGTLDNSSAFWNPTTYDKGNKFNSGTSPISSGNPYFNEMSSLGGIFFRGQDNHVYEYDGYSLTRLSRIITPNVTSSSRRKANSWTQTTAADFSSGSGFATFTDTTSQSGSVVLQQYSNVSNASSYGVFNASFTNVAGGLHIGSPGALLSLSSGVVAMGAVNIGKGFILSFTAAEDQLRLQAKGFLAMNNSSNGYGCSEDFTGTNFALSFTKLTAGVGSTPATIDTGIPVDTLPHSCSLSMSATGFYTVSFDSVTKLSGTDTSFSINPSTIIFQAFNLAASSITVSNLTVTSSTGTYYSAINNAPSLATWGNFTATDAIPGLSSTTYFTRSSTNSFTVLSTTPTWVLQTKNSQVTASTGTFFQSRIDFFGSTTTVNPILNDFTFNWFEGTALDKAYINYFQDAIWFSVSSGSNTATNNTIFYLDLLNNTWLKDDITANGFLVENNALYFGSPTVAQIYKFGSVTTDNSNAIHSYWKSMDFTGQDPTVQNSWDQADFAFAESSNTVTFTYDVDQSTSLLKVVLIPLFSARSSILKRGFALVNGEVGTYFNFKVEDNSSLAPWTLMGQRTMYEPLPWRPQLSN